MKDIETFEVPQCFWSDDEVVCSCKKIFFEVNIDFKPVRVYMCKDLFRAEIHDYIYNHYKKEDIGGVHIEQRFIDEAMEYIYTSIMYEYFKNPIYDDCKLKNNSVGRGSMWWIPFDNSTKTVFDVRTDVVLCSRPHICRSLSSMEIVKKKILGNIPYSLLLNDYYYVSIKNIMGWIDLKSKYKKYSEYGKLITSFNKKFGRYSYCEMTEKELNEFAILLLDLTIKEQENETSKQ